MENRIIFRAGKNRHAKATHVHRTVNRELFELKLLRGNFRHTLGIAVGLFFKPLGWKNVESFLKLAPCTLAGQKGCFSVNSMSQFAVTGSCRS